MAIEAGSQIPQYKKDLKDFYEFVSHEIPEGFAGHENAYPVVVGQNNLEAIIFGADGDSVSFGLFPKQNTYTPHKTIAGTSGKYARKTLEITATGVVREDTRGVLPDFDITDNEPDFTALSNEEIAVQVVRQIKSYKRSGVN